MIQVLEARAAITSAQGVHVSAATVWELTVPTDRSKRLPEQGLELLRDFIPDASR